MGRPGDPDDLVGALLFLASDASRFVTGETMSSTAASWLEDRGIIVRRRPDDPIDECIRC